MKHVLTYSLLFLIILLNPFYTEAQNLVPNNSFEQYTACPSGYSNLVGYCNSWGAYGSGTPDYFNSCDVTNSVGVPKNVFGYQFGENNGHAYAGIISYYKVGSIQNPGLEFLKTSISSMVPGSLYEVSMSVSLADSSQYASDGLGVWFYRTGNTSFPSAGPVQVSYDSYGIIDDTTNWVRLIRKFTADSAYDNIVIGEFHNTSAMHTKKMPAPYKPFEYAYYYIDSVVVKMIAGIKISYTDTLFCLGNNFHLNYDITGPSSFLGSGNTMIVQLSDSNGLFVNPTVISTTTPSTPTGTLTCIIPANTPSGNKYLIKTICTNGTDTFYTIGSINIKIGYYPPTLTLSTNAPICAGQILKINSAGNTSNLNYSWTGPLSFSSQQQNVVIKSATVGMTGRYSLIYYVYNWCPANDTIKVELLPYAENLTIINNSPVCINNELILTATSTSKSVSYKWVGPNNFSKSDSSIRIQPVTYSDTGMYVVSATIEKCTVTDTTYARIIADPPLELGSNALLCNGESRLLSPNIPGATYKWQDGSTADHYDVSKAGTYWVKATTVCNVFSDSVTIDYELCVCNPFVPSAFTPNNDGLNDKIGTTYIDCVYTDYKFEIVNRYGQVMFASTNPKEKWDGTFKGEPADVGTYFYMLQIKGPRGKDFNFKGDITLIR
ncbi:MAG: gliding motility-associated C-terminal domain-containing protein [Bacteroidetes bacterium]|nr:gliding motility-associated C-terminal domain-containing protein [Bacteroidota bacterium]